VNQTSYFMIRLTIYAIAGINSNKFASYDSIIAGVSNLTWFSRSALDLQPEVHHGLV